MNTPKLQLTLLLVALLATTPRVALTDTHGDGLPVTGTRPGLTLTLALEMAMRNSPRLAAAEAAVQRSTALRLQAGKPPNPELEIEFANLDSAEDGDWLDGAEGVYRISQTLELGGKRGHRSALASLEEKLSRLDRVEVRAALAADVSTAYTALLAAQARSEFHRQALSITEELHGAVVEKVRAGKVASLDELKSSVELAEAGIAVARSRRILSAARIHLAATWGAESYDFGDARGDLADLGSIPAEALLDSLWRQGPRAARLGLAEEIGRIRLRQEKGLRIPDLSVSVGLTRPLRGDGHAYLFAMEMPLPLFDRNGDGLDAADAELRMTGHAAREIRLSARSELGAVYRELHSLGEEARAVLENALPAAERAQEVAVDGYRMGKFGLLELLDARHTLLSVREQQVDILTEYHDTFNELERLVGGAADPADLAAAEEQGD